MAFGITPVRPLNLAQNFMQGMQFAQNMKDRKTLNDINKEKLNLMPQQFSMQNEINNAKINLLRSQAARQGAISNDLDSTFGKMLEDRQRIIQQYGANSPQAHAMAALLNRTAAGSRGISVGLGNGQQIQVGGSVQNPAQFFPTGNAGMPGMAQGGITTKDPRFGSYRSAQGGVYTTTNPDGTTSTISSPTSQSTTQNQTALMGAQRAKDIINQLGNVLPQFQGVFPKAGEKAAAITNSLGITNFQSPSNYAYGQELLKIAPEGLVKAFGLNSTDANVKAFREALAPRFGETSNSLNSRILKTAQELKKFEKMSKGNLKGGFKVDNNVPRTTNNASQKSKSFTFNPNTGDFE